MTVITLFDGSAMDLADPSNAPVDVNVLALVLSRLARFNGHTRQFYSVAQHSVFVSHLVPDDHALAGLLHDAAEAYVGDIASPLKRLLGRTIEDLEDEILFRVCDVIDPTHDVYHKTNSATVRRADVIALATEARDLMNGPLDCPLDPFGPEITALPPEQAQWMFLNRYRELRPGADVALPAGINMSALTREMKRCRDLRYL